MANGKRLSDSAGPVPSLFMAFLKAAVLVTVVPLDSIALFCRYFLFGLNAALEWRPLRRQAVGLTDARPAWQPIAILSTPMVRRQGVPVASLLV